MLLHYLVNSLSASCTETVDLLHQETPDFILPDLWHPNILDLNPVDNKIWIIMQSRVYQTKICSMDERRVIDVWCDPCLTKLC